MTPMSKIAIVQFKASTDKTKNLPKILRYIKQAARNHADLCAFPEYMMFFTPASQSAKQVAQQAETINGEFVSAISECAKQNSIIVVGTMLEKSKKKDRVYDTSFVVIKAEKLLENIGRPIFTTHLVSRNHLKWWQEKLSLCQQKHQWVN